MDMDSSSQSHTNTNNWLAFSLSNNSHLFPSGVVLDQDHGSRTDTTAATVFGGEGGPKLEDFLGASGFTSADGGAIGDGFDAGAQGIGLLPGVHEIYDDSELKTIAAGFFTGFATNQSKHPAVAPAPVIETPVKKSGETFGQRTSIFRGVTRHRWTGRYEAHLWDNSCRREGQSRKGRQVYLGGYDKEEKAARAYDLAALKYWGPTTTTNFPVSDYEKELEEMKNMTRQEFVASLRRKSSGFSRGASIYRGVTRHHQHGRWQARIGRVAGNKDLYLGTFSTQEEAAEAYDIAAIKFRGLNAVTNFDMSRYDVQSIASSKLPVGGAASSAANKSITSSDPSDTPTPDQIETTFQNNTTSTAPWAPLGYGENPNFHEAADESTTLQAPSTTTVLTHHHEQHHGFRITARGYNYHHQQKEINGTTPEAASSSVCPDCTTRGEAQRGVLSNNGSWIAPHPFQGAKAGLSAFQTPIFGIE